MEPRFPTKSELEQAYRTLRLNKIKQAQERREARKERPKRTVKARVEKTGQEPRRKIPGYLQYLRRQRCFACLAEGRVQATRTDPAHPKFGIGGRRREFGLGERSHDDFAVPLCREHHEAEHRGQRAFWDRQPVGVEEVAAVYFAAYQAGEDGVAAAARLLGRTTP